MPENGQAGENYIRNRVMRGSACALFKVILAIACVSFSVLCHAKSGSAHIADITGKTPEATMYVHDDRQRRDSHRADHSSEALEAQCPSLIELTERI